MLSQLAATVFILLATLVVTRAFESLLGMRPQSTPRQPTVVLVFARRHLPRVRVALWMLSLAVVGCIWIPSEPTAEALLLTGLVVIACSLGLRDLINNAVAGVVIAVEGTPALGQTITVGDSTGTVTNVGLVQLCMTTEEGRALRLPNRRLLREGFRVAPEGCREAAFEMYLVIPDGMSLPVAKRTAYRAAMLSRFASPRTRSEVFVDSDGDGSRVLLRAHAASPVQLDSYRSDITELWLEATGLLSNGPGTSERNR